MSVKYFSIYLYLLQFFSSVSYRQYLFKLNILCLLWLWFHNIFLSFKYVIFNHFLRKVQLIFSLILNTVLFSCIFPHIALT